MLAFLGSLVLLGAAQGPSVYYDVPLAELTLGPGGVLPQYLGGNPWENWENDGTLLPWALLDGPGEVLFLGQESVERAWPERPSLRMGKVGELFVRTDAARDLAGTLFLPRASGSGFLKLAFTIPAARATASAADYRAAELLRAQFLADQRLPGGAWFRHRVDELRAALDPALAARVTSSNRSARWTSPGETDALELFSGGRALYENLQLERGLPAAVAGEDSVALDSIEGLSVRAIDWKALTTGGLASGETKLDALAALIPADQHALFFPSFAGLVDVLDEADRLGSFGLAVFEERSSNALTKQRYEKQLCLELSTLGRTLGPLLVESAALTGSDAYLRSGSDVALLLAAKSPEAVRAYVDRRQDAAVQGEVRRVEGKIGALAWRGVVDASRAVSSYVATLDKTVVVTNSLVQLERIAGCASKAQPALAGADEYRYFRQRYPLGKEGGSEGESGLVVLSDATIRRWCSPRWRIGSARLARIAAELSEEHAAHQAELVAGVASPRALGVDPSFAELGELTLTDAGLRSARYGTLDFLTPIAELPLEKVTEREASAYKTWREGYQEVWSNFFDPIGARLSVSKGKTAVDLTVRPLILGTEYADLRKMTGAKGLEPGAGDAHPEALVRFAMAIDPNWEQLRSVGQSLGPAAQALGADPFGWLGGWVSFYLDDGDIWDDVLSADDLEEVLQSMGGRAAEIPFGLTVAVANPLKLALFLTSLRAFADGTAPGMTEWKERVAGERRFVQITSPGMGEGYSIFYATTPKALLVSLNEATLLRAIERTGHEQAGADDGWSGAQARLELGGRGLELIETLLNEELGKQLTRQSWRNLPILNEWRRLYPERDPVEVHQKVFRERLECPGGGSYAWNAEWRTMESSVCGHPGAPKPGLRRPAAWDEISAVRFALGFEDDGLRVRAELRRK